MVTQTQTLLFKSKNSHCLPLFIESRVKVECTSEESKLFWVSGRHLSAWVLHSHSTVFTMLCRAFLWNHSRQMIHSELQCKRGAPDVMHVCFTGAFLLYWVTVFLFFKKRNLIHRLTVCKLCKRPWLMFSICFVKLIDYESKLSVAFNSSGRFWKNWRLSLFWLHYFLSIFYEKRITAKNKIK